MVLSVHSNNFDSWNRTKRFRHTFFVLFMFGRGLISGSHTRNAKRLCRPKTARATNLQNKKQQE